MSTEFTRETAATWMRRSLDEHRDPRTLEVDCTGLAEACAEAFDMADEESLSDCDVFASVCDARRDGWIASMESALSALSLGSVAA